MHIFYILLFFLEWEMFQIEVAEEIKKKFMFNYFFFVENPAVYEII